MPHPPPQSDPHFHPPHTTPTTAMGSYFECFVIREWHNLEKIGRCGFVGGSVSLKVDIEVSKAHDGTKYVISHLLSLLQS